MSLSMSASFALLLSQSKLPFVPLEFPGTMSPQAFRYHLPPRALRYHLSPGVSWYHLVSFVAQTLSWYHVPTNFPVPFVPPSSLVPFAPLASPLAPPPPSHSLAHAREGYSLADPPSAARFAYCPPEGRSVSLLSPRLLFFSGHFELRIRPSHHPLCFSSPGPAECAKRSAAPCQGARRARSLRSLASKGTK